MVDVVSHGALREGQQWCRQEDAVGCGGEIRCGWQLTRAHSPVLATTEVGVPSIPATWTLTRTVYSVFGSSPSSSATVASPETNWDLSGPEDGKGGSSRVSHTLLPNPLLDLKEPRTQHSFHPHLASTTLQPPGPAPNPWSTPRSECQEILYPVAPGTLFQLMVMDELLVRETWTVLTAPNGSGGRGDGDFDEGGS